MIKLTQKEKEILNKLSDCEYHRLNDISLKYVIESLLKKRYIFKNTFYKVEYYRLNIEEK